MVKFGEKEDERPVFTRVPTNENVISIIDRNGLIWSRCWDSVLRKNYWRYTGITVFPPAGEKLKDKVHVAYVGENVTFIDDCRLGFHTSDVEIE
jgi:hypothetical protein